MSRVILECMHGLGDNVYQRVVAQACLLQGHEVWARTVWPQLWWDLPVKVIPASTELRTQRENVEKYSGKWDDPPASPYERRRPHYGTNHFMRGLSIPNALLETSSFNPGAVNFGYRPHPDWVEWAKSIRPKGLFGIVHPGAVRLEWYNPARPCLSSHLQTVVDAAPDHEWWEVGYVAPPDEMRYGEPIRGVSRSLMRGELSTEQLIGLMAVADVVVTCVGFMLPLGIALRTPTLCIYGGDVPDRLLVEPWMIGAPYRAVEPSPFCACALKTGGRHRMDECNKAIPADVLVKAFRELRLEWRGDHGFYPVHLNGQYGKAYFDKYVGYEKTALGEALNQFRVEFVNHHFPNADLFDVGPGSCQFIRATNARGLDVNPHTNNYLRDLGRFDESATADVLCFWDSLEHLPDPAAMLRGARKGVAVTIPIFRDLEHVKGSKHFRTDEHFWYFTHEGFVAFMERQGFRLRAWNKAETELGREDVNTYAFERV